MTEFKITVSFKEDGDDLYEIVLNFLIEKLLEKHEINCEEFFEMV